MSFVWKTDEQEGESIVLLFFFNFCSLRVLETFVDEEWWGGAGSVI